MGMVSSHGTNKPVIAASVFLSNTSFGTTTDENGYFKLPVSYIGKFDLVISSIGFETFVQTINVTNNNQVLSIVLKPQVKDLGNVILAPVERNGWEKWGKFFTENFIGTTPFGKMSAIKNADVLTFRHSKKEKKLWAYADEPLVIENKALGYILKYKLENFEYDFANNMLFFVGYPLFEDMTTKRKGLQKKWMNNRVEAYDGSMMHFMRSVYRNSLRENGFEIRHLIKLPNVEKQRIKPIVAKRSAILFQGAAVTVAGVPTDSTSLHADTLAYYRKIMAQKDVIEQLGKTILSGDSIAYAIDSFTAGLHFNDYLHIIYKNKPEPAAFAAAIGRPNQRQPFCVSELVIRDGNPIQIQSNGSYYDPTKLLSVGFWAWSEKVGMMLPFNYKPPEK